jgi:hypothetical protein
MTNNKFLDAALEYAAKDWYVLPVVPGAKNPVTPNGQKNATTDPKQITRWWTHQYPNANIGLFLARSGLVCVDVDSYKGDCGFDEFMLGREMPTTLIQKSASGGTHYVFRAAEGVSYPGMLCSGVELKWNGFIVVAPSNFNGGEYEWQTDDEPAEAPDWLPIKPSLAARAQARLQPSSAPLDHQRTIADIKSGNGWHNEVLRLVGSYVAKGWSDEDIHQKTYDLSELGYTIEDTRAEVQKMIDGARDKGFDMARAPDFEPVAMLEAPNSASGEAVNLIKSAQGKSIANQYNVYTVLKELSPWSDVLAYDEFGMRKMVANKPPNEPGNPNLFKLRDIKETDYNKVAKWLNVNGFSTLAKQIVIDAVAELCEDNLISPVRNYLENLSFDPASDEPQLSLWMQRYLGVLTDGDNRKDYVEAVSRLVLIQAVARALDPGCQADTVPILEGKQGVGKSTALRILHSTEWFADALPPMGTKDASDFLRGKWGIELPELAFQKKAELETQKAFISRRVERFRPAYGREEICYERRCVFWGTTNRADYMKDETGNRRFLPIKVESVDLVGLKANRDKLWAEAVYYYKRGEKWHLDSSLLPYASDQARDRFEDDPWGEVINDKLKRATEISIHGAFQRCFPDVSDVSISQQMSRRMSYCLQQAGWEKSGKFTSGSQRNQTRFVRENTEDASEDAHEELDDLQF